MSDKISISTVGVAVLTLNAERDIQNCLTPILRCVLVEKCIVIDSSSTDRTVEIVKSLGVELYSIPRSEFNHGATRELARKFLATDVVVMVTQDACATGPESISALVAPLLAKTADVTYARQLPRIGADIFEAFPRQFNYPEIGHSRRLADSRRLGVFTFFCSDSFAAYQQSSLDSIGGFPTVLTNEDYFAVARILEKGGVIAYVAESTVYHSHRYSLKQEFQRYFDTGYVRGERPWVQDIVGNAEGHGVSMIWALFGRLGKEAPWLIPYAVLQVGAKWLGYRIGFHSVNAPLWWKKRLSGQRYYWTSRFYTSAKKPRAE